jgi:RsiW-degrading membrane proteinase PrsW (M82 family)
MYKNLPLILLNIIGLLLVIKWFRQQFKDYKNFSSKTDYLRLKRFKNILLVAFIIIIPILIINFTSIEELHHLTKNILEENKLFYAVGISFIISLVWLLYILKLDIFNKEKKRHIILIFILSIFFTSLTDFPYYFIHWLGFKDTIHPFGSFIYSVFGIGFIEESIKLIPLLLMLKFTKAIDEPYDYILYASVSALGFAFIENAMYLNNYGLYIINGRALYATVAHMTFSSILAYGLFLNKFKLTKLNPTMVFIFFYLLAIFSHGFYDFWLINKYVAKFSGVTTLFLLLLIHVWFSIKNNTINTSNYYTNKKIINNDSLKIYLIFGLLSIFMLSYVYVAFESNSDEANNFFMESAFVYAYIIFYLVATLTKYNLVKGLLNPIKLSIQHIIPKKRS